MKLFSTLRNKQGKQLVCEDAIFDPNLIAIASIDEDERVIGFHYDFSECGHPLNLPFDACDVEFLVKLTTNDIHICAMVDVDDSLNDELDEYVEELNTIEFDVRMTTEEKFALLLAILNGLLIAQRSQNQVAE